MEVALVSEARKRLDTTSAAWAVGHQVPIRCVAFRILVILIP